MCTATWSAQQTESFQVITWHGVEDACIKCTGSYNLTVTLFQGRGGGGLVRLRTGIGMNFSVCGGDYLSHCRARNASDLVRGNVLHRLCCTDFR